jgi:hypothetical protein
LTIAAIAPLILISISPPVNAATGGPDSFGYSWMDSNDPNPKITYNWISATSGTNTGLIWDDQYVGPFNIGFSFNFYGTSYTQFYINDNGCLFFGTPDWMNLNDPIPTIGTPDTFVAVLWDDLAPDYYFPNGNVYYQLFGSAPNRYLVIEWNNLWFWGTPSNDPITFEAILYEAGGKIKLQYQDVIGSYPGYDLGGSATVGIEDSTGSTGLQYSYNSAVISNNLAIEFSKDKPGKIDGLSINDGFGPNNNICGAGTPHTFRVKVSDPNGYQDVDRVMINLDYLNENLSYIWRQTGDEFEESGDLYGYASIVSTATDSYHDSNFVYTLDFKIKFDWDFPHENFFGVMVRSWDYANTQQTKYFVNIARVENDLELIGKTSVTSEIQGPIANGGWVKKDETLNWSGLTAVYEGVTDGYPPDTDFDITVERLDTSEFWIDRESSGELFSIFMPAESDLDIETVEYNIKITGIPENGQDISDPGVFILKIDGLAPDPPSNIIIHADSVDDTQTYADDDDTIYITWDSVASEDSGTCGYYYSFINNGTTNEGFFTTETSAVLTDAVEGLNEIFVWTCDNVGNIGLANSKSIIIDFNTPKIINYTPTFDIWQNDRAIACKLTIKDVNETGQMGSGVDTNHVQYSYSTSGPENFGTWAYIDYLTEDFVTENFEQITIYEAVVNLNFKEGEDNYIRWRLKDLAGNGYVETGNLQIKVDTNEVIFADGKPAPDKWVTVEPEDGEMRIDYSITLKDMSSGVDAESIEYCYSNSGAEEYGEWTSAGKTKNSAEIECTVNIPVKEGENNYIKWRAKDIAGNGYTESEDMRIRINTVPRVIITSPVDGSEYTTKNEISFNGLQTYDPDGDKLSLYWKSNISSSIGSGALFLAKLYPGYHKITLYANDGNGHNATSFVNISVIDMDKDTDKDGIPDGLDTDDDNDGLLDVDEISIGTDPLDTDTDGDKIDDGVDVFPLDSREWEDTDGDGTGNNADLDDDDDGYPDSIDSDPLDASKYKETSDTDTNLLMMFIGIIILIVLILVVFYYIRNKRTEEEQMEMEMIGIMPGTSGLPPSAMAQQGVQYFPMQQPPQSYSGEGGPQFALQPAPDQTLYQPQYQLPPAQLQDQTPNQGNAQQPRQQD